MMGRASIRLRTTLAAMLVVALALLIGGLALVWLQRDGLRSGVEATAEQRAETIGRQIEVSGVPRQPEEDPEDDELEAELVQVTDAEGEVVLQAEGGVRLPTRDRATLSLPGADADYTVATEEIDGYVVSVAASLEEVSDSTQTLVPLLLIGLPTLLLVVGGTTWLVVGRALAPVERIRAEVADIDDDRLDRRVPEPPSNDEIGRLARTMNAMLGRLEDARRRQQRFVADSSHELRSPLAGLRQTAEVAIAHPEAMPPGELAHAVREESVRMQRLIEQMLTLARTGASTHAPREVDLDDLALTEVSRLRPHATIDASAVRPTRVRGDELALAQVVRNLLDNAIRHSGGGLAVGVTEKDGVALLWVDDDGAGVPEGDRERIFDRFVRLDEARARDDGGSGLGLAIVRETVRAHGGEAWAETAPGGGARFVVRLPVVVSAGA